MQFGTPHLPAGKSKVDEFFGKVETYRGTLVIDLPLKSPVPATGFTLSVVSQGCADIGVCYTPLTQSVKLFPAAYSDAGTRYLEQILRVPCATSGRGRTCCG